ncbi:MAG: excinuclease ABC subunit A [Silicimonas sp.]|nr:excinuclease ABC subunit A [Silicimonas sp.]
MLKTLTFALVAATLALPGAAIAKGPKGCPPGLQKKSPACVPPGLAKKGVRYGDDRYDRDDDDDEWRDRDYSELRVGDRVILDGREYIVVRTDDRIVLRRGDDLYRLPWPDAGNDYVRIGDAIVRVNRETRQVIQWIRLTDLIFG